MAMRTSARLRVAAAALSGVLAATCLWGWLFVDHASQDADALAEAREQGRQEARAQIVLDRPVPEGNWMPLWLQTDPQWSRVEYSTGTIESHGCGLTCAAMTIEYMTTQDVTPLILSGYVGDECLTGGINDMAKFSRWICERYPEYGIEHSGAVWTLDEALALVDDGWLVFAGMEGALGGKQYGSHVVLLWGVDENGNYLMRDPDDAENSARPWTRDELVQATWGNFNGLKGGHYGA